MSPALQDYLAAERTLETYLRRLSPEDRAYVDAREAIDDCVWQSLATNNPGNLWFEQQHAVQPHVPTTFPFCGDTSTPIDGQVGYAPGPHVFRRLPDSDED